MKGDYRHPDRGGDKDKVNFIKNSKIQTLILVQRIK